MAPSNPLPVWGNDKTMNLNHLILTNIQSSPYFKVNLFELKTYHEVIDEIYYKVSHLEPWEKGSRKTAGQTGMCGGVRGVGAGGIVSSAYCLLYKLFTLKLTRKQLMGLLNHEDSPYIRGLGFMYIRYTQPPKDLWEWYEPYLDDEEEIDVKAGGGHTMLIGEMIRQWLVKIEWYCTLFPRIPVPIQKEIQAKLKEYLANKGEMAAEQAPIEHSAEPEATFGEAERAAHYKNSSPNRERPVIPRRRTPPRRATPPFDIAAEIAKEKDRQIREKSGSVKRSRSRDRHHRSRSPDKIRPHTSSYSRDRRPSPSRDHRKSNDRSIHSHSHHRSRSRDRHSHSKDKRGSHSHEMSRDRKHYNNHDRYREKRRSRSREREYRSKGHSHRDHVRESSFDRDLRKAKERLVK